MTDHNYEKELGLQATTVYLNGLKQQGHGGVIPHKNCLWCNLLHDRRVLLEALAERDKDLESDVVTFTRVRKVVEDNDKEIAELKQRCEDMRRALIDAGDSR